MGEVLERIGELRPEVLAVEPLVPDFATIEPIDDAFDWPEIMAVLSESNDWEINVDRSLTVFRSVVSPSVEIGHRLGVLDHNAHVAAQETDGYGIYFRGTAVDGNNLSFCVWRDRDASMRGTMSVYHDYAAAAANDLYEDWSATVYTIRLTHEGGVEIGEVDRYAKDSHGQSAESR